MLVRISNFGRGAVGNGTGGKPVHIMCPGIQPSDIEELLNNGSKTIVLSRGMWLALKTSKETLDFLNEKNITVHIAETRAASEIYNDLASDGEAVGGLFHSTC